MANISKIKVGSTSYGITATPTAHASTATTYGAASASNYGHVKLSDNYTSSAGAAASGIGASSAAVYNAYNTLNSNLNTFKQFFEFGSRKKLGFLTDAYGGPTPYGFTIRWGSSSYNTFVDDTYWLTMDANGELRVGVQVNGAKQPTWHTK